MPSVMVKSKVAVLIAEFIIETLKPHERPVLILWRELMNAFNAQDGGGKTPWVRDDRSVHEHLKKFGPLVFRHLERHYKLTVVKVGRAIRQKLNHGQSPDRGGSRTDAFYIGCLSSSSNKTMGFVAFPREIQTDHPLIAWSGKRRMKASCSQVVNVLDWVDRANDFRTLSDGTAQEIRGLTGPMIHHVVDQRYPLFPEAIDGPATPPAIANGDGSPPA